MLNKIVLLCLITMETVSLVPIISLKQTVFSIKLCAVTKRLVECESHLIAIQLSQSLTCCLVPVDNVMKHYQHQAIIIVSQQSANAMTNTLLGLIASATFEVGFVIHAIIINAVHSPADTACMCNCGLFFLSASTELLIIHAVQLIWYF